MDPDHEVGGGFREVAQLFEVWPDESGPALAEDAEYLGGLHGTAAVAAAPLPTTGVKDRKTAWSGPVNVSGGPATFIHVVVDEAIEDNRYGKRESNSTSRSRRGSPEANVGRERSPEGL